jgi:hypothetical protein
MIARDYNTWRNITKRTIKNKIEYYSPLANPTELSHSGEVKSCSSKKFPEFYGTGKFITAFTNPQQCYLSWLRWIQSISSYPISLKVHFNTSSHLRLRLPTSLLPSGFPTKPLYALLCNPIRAAFPIHLIPLICSIYQYSASSRNCKVSHYAPC